MPIGRGANALAEQVLHFAAGAAADGARRHERICTGIAADAELLALICEAPLAQRRPNILLAAVHYLLLQGVDDPLARHYPTVDAWRDGHGPLPAVPPSGPDTHAGSDDPFSDFATFCREHRDQLAHLVATRATQTNEVGRCAGLLPGLASVAGGAGRPLAVLDIGTSAGLNLLFDRYGYDYVPGHRAGAATSPVTVRCEVRHGTPPLSTPRVAARAGLDRAPVNLANDDAALWLLACQWPDHLDRFATLRAAIDLARTEPDPPALISGDAVADLPGAVATLPDDDDAHLCLVHSWMAAYLDPDGQEALGDAVASIAATRPCSWLFAEDPGEVPGLPVPPPPAGGRVRGATALVHWSLGPDQRAPRAARLADMHSHGRWLHWYGEGASRMSQ